MWDEIRSNRIRSGFVIALIGVLLVATGAALGGSIGGGRGDGLLGGATIALVVWLVLWVVAATNGDSILLSLAGAHEVRKADHPVLFNVVEEMTIAAQLPRMPRVYVVDDPSPNAFATGLSPEKSAITVTTGLLRLVDRDELQGVVAHEIGHVTNRDVKAMSTAGIMVGAIVLLAEVGRRVVFRGGFRSSRSSGKGGGGQVVILIVALLFMLLAPIFAQLLYMALSRRREFLADASGALFTRYPEGLASALEKIAAGSQRIPLSNASAATAPMYIVAPRKLSASGKAGSLFSTHPPLDDRVRILRSMGGRADYGAYEAAYRAAKGRSVVGTASLATTQTVAVRERAISSGPVETPEGRYRAASNALLSAGGYRSVTCPCGAVTKLPPMVYGRVKNCLRCGRPYEE